MTISQVLRYLSLCQPPLRSDSFDTTIPTTKLKAKTARGTNVPLLNMASSILNISFLRIRFEA